MKILFPNLILFIIFVSLSCGNSENKDNIKNVIRVGTPAKHKLFSQINNGKIDASIEASIIFEKLKTATGSKIKMVGEPLFTEVNSFPFKKDESGKKLCDEVSKVIAEMREDGTLEKLAIKWFGYNPMEGLDAKKELEKLLATFN